MPIIRAHDKFFTCAATARYCVQQVLRLPVAQLSNTLFLEPSAGSGAFLELLPEGRRTGLDIDPGHPEVAQADFLAYEPQAHQPGAKVVVVGNPPFGRNSSLAMKFVNKAAEFADVIAFILPKTFQKRATQRRLHPHLHLLEEHEIPGFSFEFEGKPWDVPCVFQIWERREVPRLEEEPPLTHSDFAFVPRQEADFAVRRVGRSAGKVFRDFQGYAKTTHHFIKAADPEQVMRVLERIDWAPVRTLTAGVPCVGKEELIRHYDRHRQVEGGVLNSCD